MTWLPQKGFIRGGGTTRDWTRHSGGYGAR